MLLRYEVSVVVVADDMTLVFGFQRHRLKLQPFLISFPNAYLHVTYITIDNECHIQPSTLYFILFFEIFI